MTKLIGIIGGVSWESTVLYYKLINQTVRSQFGGLNSAKLLISSLNYEPVVALEQQGKWEEVADILVDAAQNLEKSGAELLILGCNTLHKVSPAIEKAIQIPFVHIADAVGEVLVKAGIKEVGLLGTRFTMEDGFYAHRLQDKFDLKVIVPPFDERQVIDRIIYQELCVGKIIETSRKFVEDSIKALANAGVQGVILGCTELGILVENGNFPVPIFDSTMLHAKKAVTLSLKQRNHPKR